MPAAMVARAVPRRCGALARSSLVRTMALTRRGWEQNEIDRISRHRSRNGRQNASSAGLPSRSRMRQSQEQEGGLHPPHSRGLRPCGHCRPGEPGRLSRRHRQPAGRPLCLPSSRRRAGFQDCAAWPSAPPARRRRRTPTSAGAAQLGQSAVLADHAAGGEPFVDQGFLRGQGPA